MLALVLISLALISFIQHHWRLVQRRALLETRHRVQGLSSHRSFHHNVRRPSHHVKKTRMQMKRQHKIDIKHYLTDYNISPELFLAVQQEASRRFSGYETDDESWVTTDSDDVTLSDERPSSSEHEPMTREVCPEKSVPEPETSGTSHPPGAPLTAVVSQHSDHSAARATDEAGFHFRLPSLPPNTVAPLGGSRTASVKMGILKVAAKSPNEHM